MQTYALDGNELILATYGEKGKNYVCPECLNPVRVRGGGGRQTHFFHLKNNRVCKQSQKGTIHIRLQRYIQYLFEDAKMEHPFPQIGRIADVACLDQKKIFEIQYSPITLEEASQRTMDYESLGFDVIWILHSDNFDIGKGRDAERFLRSKTCYYSDMEPGGEGMIYDRLGAYTRLVNLRDGGRVPQINWPAPLQERGRSWKFYHQGDFLHLAILNKFITPKKTHLLVRFKEAHRALLDFLLERATGGF